MFNVREILFSQSGKRRSVDRIRKLSPREVRHLILRYRIPLKQLTEQAV